MWQALKSDFTEFIRSAGEEGGTAIASLDKKLNDLDDKLTEIAGGDRNNDDYCDTDRNGDLDYTGGDANDVLFNVGGQIDSVASPPDLKEMSAAALNMGKSAASFFTGMGEKVGDAASAIRIRQCEDICNI